MKIKIGGYKTWFGPYQLAETLCFWAKDVEDEYGMKSKPDWVHNFGEWLAHGSVEPDPKVGEITSWSRDRNDTLLSKFLSWIYSKQKRTVKVHIDKWDTWSMDHTLANIVLPMLKQLKATKHGAPQVDDKDVPKELHMTKKEKAAFNKDGSTDDKFFKRWDWVMDEMIFAFEHKLDDSWEEEFRSGEHDIQWKQCENGMSQMVDGPNNTYKCDYEGMQVVNDRIQNGFRLFGRYYQNLWD
tara:strand:+ start:2992 stop:3711 length:720 start_codon:yes stop_codon:yes gene_type:complete